MTRPRPGRDARGVHEVDVSVDSVERSTSFEAKSLYASQKALGLGRALPIWHRWQPGVRHIGKNWEILTRQA